MTRRSQPDTQPLVPPLEPALPLGGRRIPHAALSYLLAAAVALLALRLGTPAVQPAAGRTAGLPPAITADLEGAAAASFCRLLLDKTGDAQLDGPGVAVMSATAANANHESFTSVQQLSGAEFTRRLRRGPRRLLDSSPQAVSMTQHCLYRGRFCYSFLLHEAASCHADQVEILIDEDTQQPVGCRFLAEANSATDAATLREWTVVPDLAGRDSGNMQR